MWGFREFGSYKGLSREDNLDGNERLYKSDSKCGVVNDLTGEVRRVEEICISGSDL